MQKDIESRSRIVSAVLKLCEWLKVAQSAGEGELAKAERAMEDERAAAHTEAVAVEQRWHSVWIQSVEWQLRLEEAVSGRSVRILVVFLYFVFCLYIKCMCLSYQAGIIWYGL